MKKFLQKRIKNEKGLTLVELLAVIVILGIIAAIAVPSIGSIIDNSRVKGIKADAQTVLSAANMYYAENSGKSTVTMETLKEEGFINDAGSFENEGAVAPSVAKDNDGNKISGTGVSGGKQVVFASATSKDISAKENTNVTPSDYKKPE